MSVKKTLTVAALSVLLGACGNDSDPDQTSDTDQTGGTDQTEGTDPTNGTDQPDETGNTGIGLYGQVFIQQDQPGFDNEPTDVKGFGTFYRLDQNFSFDLEVVYNSIVDTCLVGDEDYNEDLMTFPDVENVTQYLSAGETITLSSNNGTYVTLDRMNVAGTLGYTNFSELTVPPQGLVLDIPGDDFPAFSNVTFPSLIAPEITPTDAETTNANTNFQWTVGTAEPYGLMAMEFSFRNGVDVFCNARDDGSFSFPASVKSQIGGANAGFVSFTRTAWRAATSGGATLLMVHEWESK